MLFVAIAVVLVVFFFLRFAIVIVPNDQVFVTERLGRYSATLHSGLHMVLPLLDQIRARHPMTVQAQEISDVFETRDRQQASLTAAYRFRILDPQRASYGSADYTNFLRELVRASQRRYVAAQTWDALREDRRSLEAEVLRSVDEASEAIGVKLLEYEVKDLQAR